ncbi:MAG TPA: tRNA (adenosine(37)-N6)-threonylcarbamoyltransferase complex dimerization subunit type 1 TsaB [Flavobacteriales bacterium]|jgi:tRNA threonylcarbamoyladenosine biosynthesis protein TsaB|nr:tRNA (adenosine(37)-N6)-threonylcarbamoyltransferase complex dimerization subunit type 1 TsaB [Flavobacteriales bacterium]
MPLLLAFDTATRHCAVVLSEGDRPLAWREDASEQFSHAERLNVFIQEVMNEAGRSLNDLDAVAAGIGPGSYTGLRIGLSAAKGLCFALDKPLIGMSTLDVLCHELATKGTALRDDDRLLPMIDARRMEVFTRTYDRQGKALNDAAPLILDEAWCVALPADHRAVVFGDGADKAATLWADRAHVLHVPGIRPAVHGLASCATAYFKEQRFSDLAYLVPDYGKAPNVTQPKKKA